MRVPALIIALLAISLVATACAGGPKDADTRLAEACERQIAEVAEEEGGTPTAKSTDERLEEETLIECAGQETKVVAADEGQEDAAKDDAKGSPTDEDPGSGGDTATPATLDPAARELFAKACGSCHVLADAKTTGTFGPALDDTTLDATGIAQQIESGGGGMPPALLEGEDADSVATYVAGAAAAK